MYHACVHACMYECITHVFTCVCMSVSRMCSRVYVCENVCAYLSAYGYISGNIYLEFPATDPSQKRYIIFDWPFSQIWYIRTVLGIRTTKPCMYVYDKNYRNSQTLCIRLCYRIRNSQTFNVGLC